MRSAWRAKLTVSLALLAFAFGGVSCSKHDSVAERNAEIDRRIDERLAAKEKADEQQRLAQQEAALEAREKVLAARESSFATMIAALPAAPPPTTDSMLPADDGASLAQDSPATVESYGTYPVAQSQVYPEPYGYVSGSQPYYSDPLFCPPTTTFVSVINQQAIVVNPRRNFRRGGNDRVPRQPMRPAPVTVPRTPVINHRPPVPARPPAMNRPAPIAPPVRTFAPRPVRPAGAPQVVARRTAAKPVLAQSR